MRRALVPLAAALLLAGCGGTPGGASAGSGSSGGSGGGAGAPGSTTAPSTSAPSSAVASWGSLAGCPSVGQGIPAGAASAPTIDVDGDGRSDTEWITRSPNASGAIVFGARTASGGVFAAPFTSASPVARQVMFADLTGHGEVIALASDGRQVLLYAVSECQLIPVQNAQDHQYAFDLGFTGYGTGVGCVDIGGRRQLVGLLLHTDAQGNPTSVTRTVIQLRGPKATNGASSTVPVSSPQQAQLARSVTCGDLTLQANGVSSGP